MDDATTGLARRLEEVLGEPHARTLMDGLTFTADDELARRSDVHHLADDVRALQGDVTAVKADVRVLQGDVTAVKADVRVLQGDMAAVRADVRVLQEDVRAIHQGMEGLGHGVEGLDQRLAIQMHKEMITQTRFFAVTMGAVVVAAMGFVAAVL